MTSFHNSQSVQNQAGSQTFNGDVYFYGEGPMPSKRPLLFDADSDATLKTLDDSIIRSLAFPQMLDRRSNINMPHTRTCQWIFDTKEYQDWQAGKFGLLWIKGKPGSGKSTLMSHLYRQIWSEQIYASDANCCSIYLEFFFSARGVPLQRDPLGMFRSLLVQVFRQHTRSRAFLRKAFQDKCESFGNIDNGEHGTTWEWQRSEVEVLLMEMILMAARDRQITIFIDALDEAGERHAQEMASYFHKINQHIFEGSAAARICISCRHYPTLSLIHIHSTEVYVEQHNRDDIATYIRDHINIDNPPTDERWSVLIPGLIHYSRGVFQWICLVLPMVEKHIADGDSLRAVVRWIRQVPAELEEMYRHILQNVVDVRHRARCFQLFRWVCLAVRPLSVREMRYALAAYSPTSFPGKEFVWNDSVIKQQIKSCSGGLLEVVKTVRAKEDESNQETIQVIHQSVKDFFVTQGLNLFATLNNGLSRTVKECHGALYWSCVKYMLTVNTEEEKDLKHGLTERYPFIKYAASYALVHAKEAQGDCGHDVVEESQILSQAISALVIAWKYQGLDSTLGPYACFGTTPLHLAAFAGLIDTVEYLITVGTESNVNSLDGFGQSPLHLAAEQDHVSVAKTLIQAGASLQVVTNLGETALTIAARQGHSQLFSFLLKRDGTLLGGSDNSSRVLYAAAEHGKSAVVKLCIEAGADLDMPGGPHGNALHAAAYKGHEEVVRLLVKAGADLNIRGDQYGSALLAALATRHDRVVKMLIKAGAEVDVREGSCGTPIQIASAEGLVEIVTMLIEAGAYLNPKGGKYGGALYAASYKGHEEVVRILIEAGADIDTRGGLLGSALQVASDEGHEDIVKMFIEAGADVNSREGGYGSALGMASYKGHVAVVELLIKAGANVNGWGAFGGSALQVARSCGHADIARLLERAGAKG